MLYKSTLTPFLCSSIASLSTTCLNTLLEANLKSFWMGSVTHLDRWWLYSKNPTLSKSLGSLVVMTSFSCVNSSAICVLMDSLWSKLVSHTGLYSIWPPLRLSVIWYTHVMILLWAVSTYAFKDPRISTNSCLRRSLNGFSSCFDSYETGVSSNDSSYWG